jgi:hypothetical protein
MENRFKQLILDSYKKSLKNAEISKIVGCPIGLIRQVILNENLKASNFYPVPNVKLYDNNILDLVKYSENLHLEKSLDLDNIYFLFTKICEKTLKTDGFRILNSGDFSEVELLWLEKNYKFRCKNKFLLRN